MTPYRQPRAPRLTLADAPPCLTSAPLRRLRVWWRLLSPWAVRRRRLASEDGARLRQAVAEWREACRGRGFRGRMARSWGIVSIDTGLVIQPAYPRRTGDTKRESEP